MGPSPEPAPHTNTAVRDHGFHELRVAQVVRETADANSFVLDVPAELRDRYTYEAGQFLTFRVCVDGTHFLRSYSMSSSPAVDDVMKVTVKRVPGGIVSNWMNDTLRPGDTVEATLPAGVFCLGDGDTDVVAFGAGSGITPVISIVKSALATTTRRVHLLYANRDRDSIIFATELGELVQRHTDRLRVVHHLDVEQGFVDRDAVRDFASGLTDAEHFICGPAPFMDIVETTLLASGVDTDSIRIERFTPGEQPVAPTPAPAPAAAEQAPSVVTIDIDGNVQTASHRPGTTVLQMARQLGMSPPSSCEAGSCATCMARVTEGAVSMRTNNALTDEEVESGWVLTCQSVPTTPTVHVIYGFD